MFYKLLFDKILAFVVIIGCLPIFLLLLLANLIEDLFIKENREPLFFIITQLVLVKNSKSEKSGS